MGYIRIKVSAQSLSLIKIEQTLEKRTPRVTHHLGKLGPMQYHVLSCPILIIQCLA